MISIIIDSIKLIIFICLTLTIDVDNQLVPIQQVLWGFLLGFDAVYLLKSILFMNKSKNKKEA